ncbi:uncharacterized protein [Fopius arisanus]|uniref:Uncharacterized protein n=1 Tax=Fopius arisanus TaxID=64838 RepID=A0A9R1TML7_9HYME|nr:PREDICTED: uncharacterized protein LOC105273056 [Fopius arisanus]
MSKGGEEVDQSGNFWESLHEDLTNIHRILQDQNRELRNIMSEQTRTKERLTQFRVDGYAINESLLEYEDFADRFTELLGGWGPDHPILCSSVNSTFYEYEGGDEKKAIGRTINAIVDALPEYGRFAQSILEEQERLLSIYKTILELSEDTLRSLIGL